MGVHVTTTTGVHQDYELDPRSPGSVFDGTPSAQSFGTRVTRDVKHDDGLSLHDSSEEENALDIDDPFGARARMKIDEEAAAISAAKEISVTSPVSKNRVVRVESPPPLPTHQEARNAGLRGMTRTGRGEHNVEWAKEL